MITITQNFLKEVFGTGQRKPAMRENSIILLLLTVFLRMLRKKTLIHTE